jgi:hypothetical protein
VVRELLHAAGVARITSLSDSASAPSARFTVYVGGSGENKASSSALDRLGIDGPGKMAAEGYVLGVGAADQTGLVVLAGADPTGTFYAAQTLRQLVTHRAGKYWLPRVEVRDWPAFAIRGVIEGFYGEPWSSADRLSQLDFYGRTRQNTYVYSPKDDPYLRARWRDPYPPAQLAVVKQLIERARSDHVRFTYALSPGLSVCYSSRDDERALVAKLSSLYAAGARSFAIPLDDIDETAWSCPADRTFGSGSAATAVAQSTLLNEVQRDFIATHRDVARLRMVPTEYTGTGDSPYKQGLRTHLDRSIIVQWTGSEVVAPVITVDQATAARRVYGHDILVWDNYPVNDYASDRLLLGPFEGRQDGLERRLAGITVNPMVEAEASKIAEFTSGSFLWNPSAYRPDQAWQAALHEVGGSADKPLALLAENSSLSPLLLAPGAHRTGDSAPLRGLLAAFWRAYRSGSDAMTLQRAAARLSSYFTEMANAPAAMAQRQASPALLAETGPWLDKLALYGEAGGQAVAMLLARKAGDGAKARQLWGAVEATSAAIAAISQRLCTNVCQPFLDEALATEQPR